MSSGSFAFPKDRARVSVGNPPEAPKSPTAGKSYAVSQAVKFGDTGTAKSMSGDIGQFSEKRRGRMSRLGLGR